MEFRNNNRQAERELSEAYYKTNKVRNVLLIITIAMTVILLYGSLSIAYGKIRSDYLIDVRGMGTLATVSLENGSERQYKQMQSLSYLSEVGIKKTVAKGEVPSLWQGELVYLDETAYKNIVCPAFTDIFGYYPVKENEIMMPIRCLNQLGISEPVLNMAIHININEEKEKIFYLSGYYTDYVDGAINIPEMYVSKSFAEEYINSMFPVDKIMAVQTADKNGEQIEQKLYSDLTMEYDSQQVIGENPMVTQSVEGVFGSIAIATGCGGIIILCAFMMIYNVVSISIGKEIRQYGLLKVIGTTNVQLKRIARRQNNRNMLFGILTGSVIGSVSVKLFLPYVLQRLFMRGLGKSDVSGFYPKYLGGAIVIVVLIEIFASQLVLKKVFQWNALESLKYVDVDVNYKKEKIISNGEVTMFKLAWRNVIRSKKRLVISCISLLLGGIVALGALVIATGTNIQNQIEEKPDFNIGILAGIFRHPEKIPNEINDNTPVLSDQFVKEVLEIDGIRKQSVEVVQGSYALVNFSKDQSLLPRMKSLEKGDLGIAFATLQIVDEDYIDKLENYISENHLNIDLENVREGAGCILLHHHEMSEILDKEVAEVYGKPVHFYSLNAYGKEENQIDKYIKGKLKCSGYLDCTAKYFPKLQTTSMGNSISYFIMTQKAFESLNFVQKTFDISFDTTEKTQPLVNQKLSQIVQKENKNSKEMDTYYFNANYTLVQTQKDQIDTANIILGTLAGGIMLIGVMNYCNTILANQMVRKREFAIMENIGLTKKQRWHMIFLEGMCYWMINMIGLLTVGSAAISILGMLIKKKLLYFHFVYPVNGIIILALVMFGVNFVLAKILYNENSIVNNIK